VDTGEPGRRDGGGELFGDTEGTREWRGYFQLPDATGTRQVTTDESAGAARRVPNRDGRRGRQERYLLGPRREGVRLFTKTSKVSGGGGRLQVRGRRLDDGAARQAVGQQSHTVQMMAATS